MRSYASSSASGAAHPGHPVSGQSYLNEQIRELSKETSSFVS